MSDKENLENLIDKMRRGVEMYPNVDQRACGYLHFDSDMTQIDDDQVCGACAIGFALLAEGVNTRRKLSCVVNEFDLFPALRINIPIEGLSMRIWDVIVEANDNNEQTVPEIIEALETIKNSL